jgi:hypothetical protein
MNPLSGSPCLPVHLRSTHSSPSEHCSSARNARECTPLMMRVAVAIEIGANHQGVKIRRVP